MPDASAVGASHDIIQILFYFVCGLSLAIGSGVVWFCRYILLPMRDRHFTYLDHQEIFMDQMLRDNTERTEMHRDNLKKLSEIHRISQEIHSKIKCPVADPKGPMQHA